MKIFNTILINQKPNFITIKSAMHPLKPRDDRTPKIKSQFKHQHFPKNKTSAPK